MEKHFSKFIFTALLATFISCSLLVQPSHAATQRPKVFLQVSPAKQQIKKLSPGQTYHGSFKVQNVGTGPFNYEIYATPFKVKNENYDKEFEKSTNYSQIDKWFTFSQTKGRLLSDTEVKINYTIQVPKNIPSGSQHVAIMASTADGASKGNIKAISRVGMILRANLGGKTKTCAKILENNIPSVFLRPPISANSRLENCGNIDLPAKYKLTVTSVFSNRPDYISKNNSANSTQTLYPETKFFNLLAWNNSPKFGLFWVEQEVKVADQVSHLKKLCFVCPLWLIIICIIFILAVIFWLVMRFRERKNSKKQGII